MKSAISILFYSLLSGALFGQDTSQVRINHSADALTVVKLPVLSFAPSAQQLSALFSATESQVNPKIAIQMAASKGDSAVTGLAQILVGNSGPVGSPLVSTPDTLMPTKIFALSVLETIGSPAAIAILLQSVSSDKSPLIRAYALNALSKTYYKKVQTENLTPGINVIGVLFQNVDDPTYIGDFQKSISQISYEGLMRWTGLDFGDPCFADARTKAGGAEGPLSPEAYRKLWWANNATKLAWNRATGHFEAAMN
jgi:hypothetical protein